MPPKLLAHFKSKNDKKDGKVAEKKNDKEKRKEALSKARSRIEEKSRKKK